MRRVNVVVIGGGQAGLAASYFLTAHGLEHVILEQDRIGESWRSKRWDSLRLIAPNWTMALPGFPYDGDDVDGFMGKDEVATRLVAYAQLINAPVHEGVRVTAVERNSSGDGFHVRTEHTTYEAANVVLATGALQKPVIPSTAADLPPRVEQLVAYAYRNPAIVQPGAILIVGSGETGCQIAEELCRSGRTVYLAVGRSWWTPRRYRGQDMATWARATGYFTRTVDDLLPGERTGPSNPQLTGTGGGHDLSLNTLAREGVVLTGRFLSVRDGKVFFAQDLAENLAWGDVTSRDYLQSIDDHVREQGLEAPEEEPPDMMRLATEAIDAAPAELDLTAAGIGTVIWATGYRPDFRWLRVPVLDHDGYPVQRRGVTAEQGLYFLGLDWLHSAKSGLFAGIGEDADYLVTHMVGQLSEPFVSNALPRN